MNQKAMRGLAAAAAIAAVLAVHSRRAEARSAVGAGRPMQARITAPANARGLNAPLYTVPAGFRLQIEDASAAAASCGVAPFSLALDTTVERQQVRHFVVSGATGASGCASEGFAGRPVSVHADPGTTVFVYLAFGDFASGALSASISGRLIPLEE